MGYAWTDHWNTMQFRRFIKPHLPGLSKPSFISKKLNYCTIWWGQHQISGALIVAGISVVINVNGSNLWRIAENGINLLQIDIEIKWLLYCKYILPIWSHTNSPLYKSHYPNGSNKCHCELALIFIFVSQDARLFSVPLAKKCMGKQDSSYEIL